MSATDHEAFRAEAHTWLEENFPKSLSGEDSGAAMLAYARGVNISDDQQLWKERMGNKGWGVPTWPTQYGGGGLSRKEALTLQQEMGKVGAINPIVGMGVSMFGPTLLEYGTEDQKQQYIPDIVHSRVRWCQGFSEPNAGSDLASLQTRAEDKGDHFLVNGQKVWTSGGQFAQMIFCLVRTDTTVKHEGISFVVFSMEDPGIEVRPIKLIAGNSPFCETFFTDVKVPKENLIGPLNGGWSIAKRLLQHERSGMDGGRGGSGRQAQRALGTIAVEYVGTDETGRLADPDLRARIIRNEIEQKSLQQTVRRVSEEARGNQGPSAATSVMKNAFMRINQERAELTVEAMGHQGLGWQGDEDFTSEELKTVRNWLGGKAGSIYGGSNEVQSNIVAKRILGLPDMTQDPTTKK